MIDSRGSRLEVGESVLVCRKLNLESLGKKHRGMLVLLAGMCRLSVKQRMLLW